MINSVRNTVLATLNKNNYGYISPSDFNLFAKQAQLDIFEEYFHAFNRQLNKENARISGSGYADIRKGLGEVIDTFSVTSSLASVGGNLFTIPSDSYLLNKVLVLTTSLVTGTSTSVVADQLIDSAADFSTVEIGDIVVNTTDGTAAEVYTVVDSNTLFVSSDIFGAAGKAYTIYDGIDGVNEAELVSNSTIHGLNRSLLTSPTSTFPAYVREGASIRLFPNSITSYGQVRAQYIRYPLDPKWTYVTLTGGEPVFNQSQNDYQDFELPLDDEPTLVKKILQYAGMSIREIAAVQFAQAGEQSEKVDEKQ